MKLKQYAYAVGWVAIAVLLLLFVVGVVRNPTQAARKEFERQLADATPAAVDFDLARDPNFENWQRIVSSRANLWGPLVPLQQAEAPPPELTQMLAGVEPTRNKIGSGDAMRIQIRVDGKKDYYSKGQQVKGCTIAEITEADVLFTLPQNGKIHGIRLPRK